MDAVRAGLLRRWKERLSRSEASRVAHTAQMRRLLSEAPVQTIQPIEDAHSVYLRLPVLMRSKQEKESVCRLSLAQGLGVSAMYPSAIGQVAELSDTLANEPVPQSALIAERLVTLPTHELVSDEDVKRICSTIIRHLRDPAAGPQSVSGPSQCCGAEVSSSS